MILVTGGAGYIGSHTVRTLKQQGFDVVVYDNLSKGHKEAVPSDVPLVIGDIRDQVRVRETVQIHDVQAVIHFAAMSLVGESMVQPELYYDNNVQGTIRLVQALRECGVNKLVFSSTAAVYGEPESVPIREDSVLKPTNVYGKTKLMIETMLADYSKAYDFSYVALRYFNAAGAWPDGSIGEDHSPESHLIPLILKTALGLRAAISIYGVDYPTPDGTCIRDYIHVCDLAEAHVLALKHLLSGGSSRIYNLGSQKGYSVREMIEQAKQVTGIDFNVVEEARRSGDPAVLVASSEKISRELGWQPRYEKVADLIRAAWTFHRQKPDGYSVKYMK